jgi:hypothetical protein
MLLRLPLVVALFAPVVLQGTQLDIRAGVGSRSGLVERLREEPVLERVDRAGTIERRMLAELAGNDLAELGDAVQLRWVGLAPPPSAFGASRASLVRVSGDRLFGRIVGGEVDDLVLELLGGVRMRLAIDDLDRVLFESRIPESWTAPIVPADEGDRLYRRQGEGLDRLDGTIEELTEEGVRFHGVLGSQVLPWNEVAALFVESLDEGAGETARGDGPPVVVDLVDGGRLRGELLRLDTESCELKTAREELRLPIAALSSLALDDGTVSFLSDLEPSEATDGAPFGDDLGMRWPHRLDRSVTGKHLRAGGRRYPRGIGVHAPSRITWALDGGWRRLLGSVAIDDEVLLLNAHGSVVFRVLVDGTPRWESPILRGGDPPLELPDLDLEGAQELTLEVDPSSDFFVADRADWLTMLLVRE